MKRINRTIAKLSLIFGLFTSFFAQAETELERAIRISQKTFQQEQTREAQEKKALLAAMQASLAEQASQQRVDKRQLLMW